MNIHLLLRRLESPFDFEYRVVALVRFIRAHARVFGPLDALGVMTFDGRDLIVPITLLAWILNVECCGHILNSHRVAVVELLQEDNGIKMTHS